MNIAHYTIKGRVPSKKNSRNVFVRGGKQFNIPSTKYKEWHRQASAQLLAQKKIKFQEAYEVQLMWYMPDNRRKDLSNCSESILDLLVDHDIVSDDSWQIIPRLYITCAGVDKENPRCEIWLNKV